MSSTRSAVVILLLAGCGGETKPSLCGDWATVPLPDDKTVVRCRPNELVIKTGAPLDKVVAGLLSTGLEAYVDLAAPQRGAQLRNLAKEDAAGKKDALLVAAAPGGFTLQHDYVAVSGTEVLYPFASYQQQGAASKVRADVIARYASLAKLIDAPEAKKAPVRCGDVTVSAKVPVLALDHADKDYLVSAATDAYSEKNLRTLLENLAANPVNAVYVTRSTINPDVTKSVGGLVTSEVAIIDTAQSRVLCRTTVTSHNSKEVAYTVTTTHAGAQSDDLNLSASIDLGKNQAREVSEAVQGLLAHPAAK